MTPGPLDQNVPGPGVVFFNLPINPKWSLHVLGVKPAADRHDRRRHLVQVLRDVLRLPVLVVIAVLHPLIPELNLVFHILLGVRKRAHFEKKLVSVGGPVVEGPALLMGRSRSWAAGTATEIKGMRQEKRPV